MTEGRWHIVARGINMLKLKRETFEPTKATPLEPYLPTATVEHLLAADKATLCDMYWQRHPRFRFLKSVKPNARLLDVGCGSGGASFWPRYLFPDRPDIEIHGVDIAKGEHAHRMASFTVVDLNSGQLPFANGTLDAAMSAHVLEHLESARNTFSELKRCLKPGGEIYIEVPGPESALPPKASVFKDAGWPMMISNFYDDTTHIKLWEETELVRQALESGLSLQTSGIVSDRYLEDTLIAAGLRHADPELMLYGFWSKAHWSRYFIFECRQ